ncbi:MAG: hypothetical protein HYY08_03095 [Firmicutes bacterium]|nr:hypothetical protein [Bacillota bacterium]
MPGILSQEEIRALLDQTSDGDRDGRAEQRDDTGVGGPEPARSPVRGPDKLSKDGLGALFSLHQDFSRLLGLSLSAYLRADVGALLLSVNQAGWEELARSLPRPALFFGFELIPTEGSGLLEISPDVGLAMAGRLLGCRAGVPRLGRGLTEPEERAVRRLVRRSLQSLETAWRGALMGVPRVGRLQYDARSIRPAPSGDPMLAVIVQVRLSDLCGRLTLCLPWTWLEPLEPALHPSPSPAPPLNPGLLAPCKAPGSS